MIHKAPVILATALLVGIGVAVWLYAARPHEPSDTLVLQGNVDVREVGLAFEVPGRIDSLGVNEGDAVTAGHAIASLDTGYFEDAVRQVRSALEAARAEFARLKSGSRPEEIEQARATTAERQVAAEGPVAPGRRGFSCAARYHPRPCAASSAGS